METINTSRRQVLWLPIGALLAGCAGGITVGGIPAFVSAINAIGSEAASVLPLLAAAGGKVPPGVGTILSNISVLANGLNSASTAVQGQSTLATIETYINELAPLITPLVAAAIPGVGPAIGLIVAALPVIEPLVNLAISQLSTAARSLASKAPPAPAPATAAIIAMPPVSGQAALDLLVARAAARGR